MSEDIDKVAYQQFNFQIALDKIETLTQHNNKLLDKIDELESELKEATMELGSKAVKSSERFDNISAEADAAMKRFTTKLKKEIDREGKSKQSQG
jgi:cell division septum initiation protein DivIVA